MNRVWVPAFWLIILVEVWSGPWEPWHLPSISKSTTNKSKPEFSYEFKGPRKTEASVVGGSGVSVPLIRTVPGALDSASQENGSQAAHLFEPGTRSVGHKNNPARSAVGNANCGLGLPEQSCHIEARRGNLHIHGLAAENRGQPRLTSILTPCVSLQRAAISLHRVHCCVGVGSFSPMKVIS